MHGTLDIRRILGWTKDRAGALSGSDRCEYSRCDGSSKTATGEETEVYGDSGYLGAEKCEDAIAHNSQGRKIHNKTNRRPSQSKNLSIRSQVQIKRREHEKSSVRVKVEHVFGVVKGLFRYRKTRYQGLRKQTAKLNMIFALANLYLADRPCMSA